MLRRITAACPAPLIHAVQPRAWVLQVENIEIMGDNKVKFDFLGKDSIRYENIVEVDPRVYKNLEKFKRIDHTGKRKWGRDDRRWEAETAGPGTNTH